MGLKEHMLAARRTPSDIGAATTADVKGAASLRGRAAHKEGVYVERSDSAEPDLTGRLPKRASSFGRGLGGGLQSFANGMARAGESLSRKSTSNGVDGTQTPPLTGASTPSATSGSNGMLPPKVPDSGHLPQFSLRLSELVNKSFLPCAPGTASSTNSSTLAGAAKSAAGKAAGSSHVSAPPLASVVYEGRRLPNRDAIQEIAATVVGELKYAAGVDAYLLRAASRSALKALSLFADRMDSLVVSPSKDASSVAVPATAREGIAPPAALEYNLGLASLEWIVEDALERCIEGQPGTIGEGMPSFVSEILTPVRKKMEATILHIVQPLIATIKASATASLAKAVATPFVGGSAALSPPTTQVGVATAAAALSVPSTPPMTATPSASSPPASALGATWIKELEGKLEGARRLLVPRLVERCGQDGEGWYISIAIHVIWKGLMILSTRSMPPPGPLCFKWPVGLLNTSTHILATEVSKRSPSPAQLSSALKSVGLARKSNDARTPGTGGATPVGQQCSTQIAAALANASAKATAAQLADMQALERVVIRFSADFLPRNGGSKRTSATLDDEASSSSDDDDEDELARAALAEALLAIKSTMMVVQYFDINPTTLLNSVRRRGRSSSTSNASGAQTNGSLPPDALRAVRAIPPLVLLHLVYTRMPLHLGVFSTQQSDDGKLVPPAIAAPPATFGISWIEYERNIAGFRTAQSWAVALVREWGQDVEDAWQDINSRTEFDKDANGNAEEMNAKSVDIPAVPITKSSTADRHLLSGQDEATPTAQSVLLQRTFSASATAQPDGMSSARSSASLPREMTTSAPTLDREKEDLVREIAALSQKSSQAKDGTRVSWSKLRRPSRSPAQSHEVSPAATPETSPPRSPNAVAMDANDASTNGRSDTPPRLRFWRTASSANTPSLSSAASGSLSSPPSTHTRPTLRSLASRSKASAAPSATAAPVVPISDEQRSVEELRLERESLQLLSNALDAASYVCGIPSPVANGASTTSNKSVHSSSAASSPHARPAHDASDLGALHPEQRMSTLSLQSAASRAPSFSSNA